MKIQALIVFNICQFMRALQPSTYRRVRLRPPLWLRPRELADLRRTQLQSSGSDPDPSPWLPSS